jgi:hypothetical protein
VSRLRNALQRGSSCTCSIEGLIAVVNREIERLLERDAILIPTRRGQSYALEERDLATGFRFFEGTFNPPVPNEMTVLPPDIFSDETPSAPVWGSPVRFFALAATAGSYDLAVGVAYSFVKPRPAPSFPG